MDLNNLLKAYENLNYYKEFEKLKDVAKNREVIFLCVGNPKVWYDSFGPLFGTMLKYLNVNYFIYGNAISPITEINLEKYINDIYKFHTNPYIVVIDSALSNTENMCVKIKWESCICASTCKTPVEVGDMCVLFSLNTKHIMDSKNYLKMLKYIKMLARMLYFVLKD